MSIDSSALSTESAQADGRRWVQEAHTDNAGRVHLVRYLAAAGLDLDAVMAARAAQIAADLTAQEIAANVLQISTVGSLASPTFVYSTMAATRSALRQAYLVASQVTAIMIGDFLSSLTDGQLQTAFGLTAGQVTTLRNNKLTPAASAAATIRATTGA